VIYLIEFTHLLARLPVYFQSADKLIVKLMAEPLGCAILRSGLYCWTMGMILFIGQFAAVLGHTLQAAEAEQAGETINPEYEHNVKAAFIYSFGRYVEWPKEAFAIRSGEFVIEVCGEDPIGPILDQIAKTKTIKGRRIVAIKVAKIEELQPCHILFISHAIPPAEQTAIINKLRNKPLLIVGDSPGFTDRGGGINFYIEGGTVKFEIKVDAIRQVGLVIDAKLLGLGKKSSENALQQK
jgi:hypothetical protein